MPGPGLGPHCPSLAGTEPELSRFGACLEMSSHPDVTNNSIIEYRDFSAPYIASKYWSNTENLPIY
jgi:hypothetical protein